VRVCVYVYIYTYISIYTYVNIHLYICNACLCAGKAARLETSGSREVRMRGHFAINMYIRIYLHIYICIYIYVCVCVYIYIYPYTSINIFMFLSISVCLCAGNAARLETSGSREVRMRGHFAAMEGCNDYQRFWDR